jgi:hypothetical protein
MLEFSNAIGTELVIGVGKKEDLEIGEFWIGGRGKENSLHISSIDNCNMKWTVGSFKSKVSLNKSWFGK